MKLYNKIDRKELIKRMQQSTEERVTISFYRYAKIKNPQLFRDYLFIHWEQLGVYGRTYVATEGINAQISVPKHNFEAFRDQLYSISFLNGIRLNVAVDDNGKSFYKLTIKVRNKIVADGLNDDSFDVTNKGKHVNAEEFNRLVQEEGTLLIDMRNHYETEVGHFKGALMPDVDTFREEIDYVQELLNEEKPKNIVMYCTGGIRCEKASAWFKHVGFDNVHQLEGGIIEYTRQVRDKQLENRFIGKNFVFDERRAEKISDDIIAQCHQCGTPFDVHTNCENVACNLLFIQCDSCKAEMEGCCSDECKHIIHLPEEEQKALRRGVENSNKIFRKGRSQVLKYKHSGKA
ncbi:MAG: hypothetical protein RL226_2126 [Bacteroidota bacterium]